MSPEEIPQPAPVFRRRLQPPDTITTYNACGSEASPRSSCTRDAQGFAAKFAALGEFPEDWLGAESNRRHVDFQSTALPTELPSRDNANRVTPWGVHYATMSSEGKSMTQSVVILSPDPGEHLLLIDLTGSRRANNRVKLLPNGAVLTGAESNRRCTEKRKPGDHRGA